MNSYAKLLGIELKHDFYRSGWCRDVDVTVPTFSNVLLKNHRGVIKAKPGGIDVYVESDALGKKPLIPFADNSALSFDLVLHNPEFLLFTEPLPLVNGPDFQLIHPQSPSADFFLRISVRHDFNQLPGSDLQLSFSAKSLCWVYYLITDRNHADTDYAIVASDSRLIWRLDEGDDLVARLAQQYPGKRILRFPSEQLLPCRENGLSGTRLQVAGTTILDNLPSPAWRNFFKTKKAPGGESVDALFQIVKYLSNTSLTKV